MDVLSEVLKVVKLEGAIYYNAEFTAPWSFRAPPSSVLAPHFAPGGGHVIIYHLLTEGQGFAGLEHGSLLPLTAGDIVIFPHGDSHIIGNGARVEPVDQERELHRIFTQGLKLARGGGGGEVTLAVSMPSGPSMLDPVSISTSSMRPKSSESELSGRQLLGRTAAGGNPANYFERRMFGVTASRGAATCPGCTRQPPALPFEPDR